MRPYRVKPLGNTASIPCGAFLVWTHFCAAKLLRTCQRWILSDFWFSSRRRADARQGEKDKKRRKGALAGVFALVNRWFLHRSANAVKVGADSVPIRCQFGDGFRCRFSAVFTPDTPKCKWPWPRPGGRFFPGCGAWSLGRWRRRRDPGSAGAIPSRPQRPGHSPGRT